MKNIIDITISIFCIIGLLVIFASCISKVKEEMKLNHLVLVKWTKDTLLDSVKTDIYNSLGTHKIAKDFVYSENIWLNRENGMELSKGFTHLWYVNFKSEFDRDSIYLVSDEEKFFINKYKERIEEIAVFDWWSN